MAVESVQKGAAIDAVVVRLMGGTVGPTTLTVAGNATLATGERVLLVLRCQGEFHTLVGMSQGKWSVHQSRGVDVVRRGPPPQSGATAMSPEKPLVELLELLVPPPATPSAGEVTP